MRAAMSALHFVNESTIQKGDQVLVYGASGSVGSYAIQLAKYYGATVTAVCSKKNLLLMKKIGADYTIDYLKTDFTKGNKKYEKGFFWKPLNLFRPY
jgi:NADPH:quinone reductase and related Zn-dependent oxidoreductases